MSMRIEYNKRCIRHPFMKYFDKKTLGLGKNTFYDKAVHVCPMCVIEARKIVRAYKKYFQVLNYPVSTALKNSELLRGPHGKFLKK